MLPAKPTTPILPDGSVAFLGLGELSSILVQSVAQNETWFSLATVWDASIERARQVAQIRPSIRSTRDVRDATLSSACVVVFLNGREQCQKYFRHSLEPSDFRARTFICMSTLLQEDVLEFHRIVTSNGGQFIESPIVGTRQLAKSLKVQVLVGCTKEQYELVKPLLCCFGTPRHVGTVGSAYILKLALLNMVVSSIVSFCTSVGMVKNSSVTVDSLLSVMKTSPFGVPIFSTWGEVIKSEPATSESVSINALFAEFDMVYLEACELKMELGMLKAIRDILLRAKDSGLGGKDIVSLVAVMQSEAKPTTTA